MVEEELLRINETKILMAITNLKYNLPQEKITQSENNLLLLKFLSTKVMVASRKDWAQDTLEWIESCGQKNYYSNLLVATHSIFGAFTDVRRIGACDQINITDIGRSILGMRRPVWVRGRGWFGGFGDRGVIIVDNLGFLDLPLTVE